MKPQIIKRNKRLRRRILQVVDAAKAAGGMRGRALMDILEDLPDCPEDDEALMGFCADLVNADYLTVEDIRTHKAQRPGLDYLLYKITRWGTALLSEGVSPDPLVEDERITPGHENGNDA